MSRDPFIADLRARARRIGYPENFHDRLGISSRDDARVRARVVPETNQLALLVLSTLAYSPPWKRLPEIETLPPTTVGTLILRDAAVDERTRAYYGAVRAEVGTARTQLVGRWCTSTSETPVPAPWVQQPTVRFQIVRKQEAWFAAEAGVGANFEEARSGRRCGRVTYFLVRL
ncbi:hypothetical protein C8F04DRAFT_1258709 [Mycena alexandri]|uniref:Uncharacterized protein n=1 Tax=Mycena alexandri TaxID=1745969 RepID=A0AAD6SZB0_9AGAR|nr:hypothetical protein C8F04DRAFT_1258709 [Mycena alexandri]